MSSLTEGESWATNHPAKPFSLPSRSAMNSTSPDCHGSSAVAVSRFRAMIGFPSAIRSLFGMIVLVARACLSSTVSKCEKSMPCTSFFQ